MTAYISTQHTRGQIQHHSLYDDEMDDYHHYGADDDGYYDEEMEEVDDEDDDESASVLSVPDPNIDFDLVYALHTFAATVEGQASVVKGDALTLLDDTNSYWWLVKVLKTAEVGYIPAENIETPYERLARLNSHRNIELTRRDIQDAFPVPPSTKLSNSKKVTMDKNVQFQAQVIIGSSDDEDFEEEYEEWNENMASSDSDGDSSSDDDYEYYDKQQIYADDQSNIHPYEAQMQASTHPLQKLMANGPSQPTTGNGGRRPSNGSIQSGQNNQRSVPFRDTLDLEQSETIKISLTPTIARDDEGYAFHDPTKKANKLEKLIAGNDDPLQQRRNSKDKEKEKKEKTGIRKFFSRNSKDGKDKKAKKGGDRVSITDSMSETASLSSQSTGYSERERTGSVDSTQQHLYGHRAPNSQQPQYNGHGNLQQASPYTAQRVSHQQASPPVHGAQDIKSQQYQERLSIPDSPLSAQQSSPSSLSTSTHLQQPSVEPTQPFLLKIYAGNVNFGELFKTVPAYPSTTAMELVQQMVDDLDREIRSPTADASLEYYLSVKGVDGDMYTLVPSDKPLTIYHSLTAHLNTPMPSLKKARRISQLMSTTENAHMGGPKEGQDVEQVQFYLYTKTRRSEEGHLYIKATLFASEVIGQTSMLKQDQSRIDKVVSIPQYATVGDTTALLLEKFHVLNGVVDGCDMVDKIKSLRLQQAENHAVKYRLAASVRGQEFALTPDEKLINVFGENTPSVHYRRSSNPDRSSVTSLSSTTVPPQADETFFILRRLATVSPTTASALEGQSQTYPSRQRHHPKAHHAPVRKDTPMPHKVEWEQESNEPLPNQMDPLEDRSLVRETMESPQDILRMDSPQTLFEEPQPLGPAEDHATDEDNEDDHDDVLLKLDQALDNLAQTRDSNENLTEAITGAYRTQGDNSSISSSPVPGQFTESKEKQGHRRSVMDSMLFCQDFGMDELMVLIRGAARYAEKQQEEAEEQKRASLKRSSMAPSLRSEIMEIFKEDQMRLDQLDKELDRLMADTMRIYC
ncbi:uncharacterized protein BYT42DRAFT_603975 [Radiomyces spectabilis]|uniref:uncharacterized protein n=1 Tax=Radiomyces spectabilis TaxID=64574 RepID=UPI0022207A51|nr:uncharacterized protein BYT42DRAFT_603975 [Radiomyces spectabilis]KAI8380896.1 hypothetical protein BYT42DRAFT_603975 [Radiomyces spectabilis]